MSILPRFSHTSGADLEAHRVPQHVIAFVEQNRKQLQRAAQDPAQQSAQIAQPPSQPPIQPRRIPPLPEDRFKGVFMQFTAATGLRLTDRDLVIEGRPVNLWALHRAVFMRNGFDSVRLGTIDGPWL